MDFAPYQDTSPEINRTLSPPPLDGRRSLSADNRRSYSPALPSPVTANAARGGGGISANPWASSAADFVSGGLGRAAGAVFGGGGGGGAEGGGRAALNGFETSLPIRLDYEACLAYLLLPPAGGVLLLIMERKSDYVRFHAWQSALLFSALFVVHLLFMWSTFLSWWLFIGELLLIVFLTMRAYRDADTLDRCEVPFFGRLASRILDDE